VKLVVDLQACQTPGSGPRGIGRYSFELAAALARNASLHDLHFLLNADFADGIEALDRALKAAGRVTCERYRLVPLDASYGSRRRRLQRIDDAILNWRYACTGADALHVSSVFEGWQAGGAHVTSRIRDVPAGVRSATLYDLIPLIFADTYLPAEARALYDARVELFGSFDLVFAISESTRRDAIAHLAIPPSRIVNIGAATTTAFRHLGTIAAERAHDVLHRHGLGPRFMLYVGGIDFRKNIDGLLMAYAALPPAIAHEVQVAVVCELSSVEREMLLARAASLGVAQPPVLTGYVTDDDLNALYNLCEVFVFPSLYEGFGLPLLEAMTCGAPAIASNASSMPEILGDPEALFDPRDPIAMARMMEGLLDNPYRRKRLGEANRHRARQFSWDAVAWRFIESLEDAMARRLVDDATLGGHRRPRVAVVVPAASESSVAGRYVARMLPYWNRPFEVDIVGQAPAPGAAGTESGIGVIAPAALRGTNSRYDCVVYHVGTGEIPDTVRTLLNDVPGVLVVHDTPSATGDATAAALRARSHSMRTIPAGAGGIEASAAERNALDAVTATLDGVVYRGRELRALIRGAQGVLFDSQRSATLLRAVWPDIVEIPWRVVEPAPADGDAVDSVDAADPDGDPRIAAMRRRPARVAELEAGACAYVKSADDARSAESLRRELVGMIAAEGWDESLSLAAGGAIEAGLALHPWSGRWMNRRA
jgi:glycosyltransferase involved in cell wall biosynthesis